MGFPTKDDLLKKIRYSETGCWLWTGYANTNGGYGKLPYKENGVHRWVRAHRLSYIVHKGPIPDGMLVCHSCDTPKCVNPDHLWLGTNAENGRDNLLKMRYFHTRSKLSTNWQRNLPALFSLSNGYTIPGVTEIVYRRHFHDRSKWEG